MNSSTLNATRIILDYAIIVSSSIGTCLALMMFIFILIHMTKMKQTPNQVPMLLTVNMYLSIFLFCALILDMHIRMLSRRLYQNLVAEDDFFCRVHAYFVTIVASGMFYSNMLQAIFRLCRVVYYNRQRLQQFNFYMILIVIQWLACCLFVLPDLIFGDFIYFPTELQCQISFYNQRTMAYNTLVIYFIPITMTIGSYMFTVRKIRHVNNSIRQQMTQTQRLMSQRDVVVLFRICILQIPMLIFSIPIIAAFILLTSGYEPWWAFQLEWLTAAISMTCVNIILALVSPQIRMLFPNMFSGQDHVQNRGANQVQRIS